MEKGKRNYLHSALGYHSTVQVEEEYYKNHASHVNFFKTKSNPSHVFFSSKISKRSLTEGEKYKDKLKFI